MKATMVLLITPQEREALQLLADGTAMNAIADHLGTNSDELAAHLSTLFGMMGAASRREAVAIAFHLGLLAPTPS